jgi:hypothetical protein
MATRAAQTPLQILHSALLDSGILETPLRATTLRTKKPLHFSRIRALISLTLFGHLQCSK